MRSPPLMINCIGVCLNPPPMIEMSSTVAFSPVTPRDRSLLSSAFICSWVFFLSLRGIKPTKSDPLFISPVISNP
ncbi:hypothetical protein MBAV_001127 [Candidatus Magnetobacterium bavaricum]|uniref:Uncharacterized protein n=1 Tax=Candidatus Magnetobacterium bavaricum TaxID=29290 RepID=A0A0F3GXV2_9BACT|nr:hypothetical protein MBAV_001127 [Candidatus Magnetobacterium bavaricum]